jgi:Ca-activated chloride channel homolog
VITHCGHWSRVLSVNLICVATAIATCAGAQSPSPALASGDAQPDSVISFVTALDKMNHPVTDLHETDLKVFVDRKPQTIKRMSAASAEKLQILLLLDISGSDRDMYYRLDWQGIMRFFHKTLHPGDNSAIGVFEKTIRLVTDWTGDVTQIESSGRRVLIVISDLLDNSSSHSLDEAIEQAQRIEVVVYPMIITKEAPDRDSYAVREDERRQQRVAGRLTTQTGGFGLFPLSGKDNENTLGRISEILTNSYVVEFSLPNSGEKKKGHEIDIRCIRKNVRVLFRERYFPHV